VLLLADFKSGQYPLFFFCAADLVLMDRAQHSAGKDVLQSVRQGDLPGIGMVIIDGIVRCGRSRNTLPAERVPEIVS